MIENKPALYIYIYTQKYDILTGSEGRLRVDDNCVQGLWLVHKNGCNGQVLFAKLDLSGVMNMQTIVSGCYCPFEIILYIADPRNVLQSMLHNKYNKTYAINAPHTVHHVVSPHAQLCVCI